jgi:hypothetical protein
VITLTHFQLATVMAYAIALGAILMRFLCEGRRMSKPEVALLSIAGTCWFVLLLYQFFK